MDGEDSIRGELMNINRLITVLAVLFGVDILLTTIAVGYMGAIELNPLMGILSFSHAMVLKLFLSIGAVWLFYKCAPLCPRVARPTILCLVVLYGGVAVSNVYQLSKVVV